jgi:putative addiction module killer protein
LAGFKEEFSKDIESKERFFLNVCSQEATLNMIEVRQTELFVKWLLGLRDLRARARIQARVDRLESGNAGDIKPVGEGVSEMKIDYGPGYRVYFVQRGSKLVILLAGGDKNSQSKDIRKAVALAREV